MQEKSFKSDTLDQPLKYHNVISATTTYEDANKYYTFYQLNVSAVSYKHYYPYLKSGITNAQLVNSQT